MFVSRLLTLPSNSRLGWKGLQGTNTLAYYENSLTNYSHKKFCFIALGPRLNITNLFTAVIYYVSKQDRAFVLGKLFMPTLMFGGKAWSRLKCFALERWFTLTGSSLGLG